MMPNFTHNELRDIQAERKKEGAYFIWISLIMGLAMLKAQSQVDSKSDQMVESLCNLMVGSWADQKVDWMAVSFVEKEAVY